MTCMALVRYLVLALLLGLCLANILVARPVDAAILGGALACAGALGYFLAVDVVSSRAVGQQQPDESSEEAR